MLNENLVPAYAGYSISFQILRKLANFLERGKRGATESRGITALRIRNTEYTDKHGITRNIFNVKLKM